MRRDEQRLRVGRIRTGPEAKRTAHRDLLGIDDGQPQSGDIEATVLELKCFGGEIF